MRKTFIAHVWHFLCANLDVTCVLSFLFSKWENAWMQVSFVVWWTSAFARRVSFAFMHVARSRLIAWKLGSIFQTDFLPYNEKKRKRKRVVWKSERSFTLFPLCGFFQHCIIVVTATTSSSTVILIFHFFSLFEFLFAGIVYARLLLTLMPWRWKMCCLSVSIVV